MQNIDPKYESLFTPWKIGNVEIKNRIARIFFLCFERPKLPYK